VIKLYRKYEKVLKYRLPAFIALLLLIIMPSDGLGFSACIFYHITGLPCPVCGLTRSMSSILHFEFLKSLAYHPLGVLVLGFIFMLIITNDPNYLSSKLKSANKILRFIVSAKSIFLLFLIVWIFSV